MVKPCRFCNVVIDLVPSEIDNTKKYAVDFITGEEHVCGVETQFCFNCAEELIFKNNIRSRKGRRIPLDKSTGKPHTCSHAKRICRYCQDIIYFDETDIRPLAMNEDGSRHFCLGGERK